jgi:3-dehydroquinate synthase
MRTILNFGHTLGHALEKISDYKMLHGVAVAYGCLFAAKISVCLNYLTLEKYQIIEKFFAKWQIYLSDLKTYDFNKVLQIMQHDKKNQQQQINMVLLQDIGQALVINKKFSHAIDVNALEKFL